MVFWTLGGGDAGSLCIVLFFQQCRVLRCLPRRPGRSLVNCRPAGVAVNNALVAPRQDATALAVRRGPTASIDHTAGGWQPVVVANSASGFRSLGGFSVLRAVRGGLWRDTDCRQASSQIMSAQGRRRGAWIDRDTISTPHSPVPTHRKGSAFEFTRQIPAAVVWDSVSEPETEIRSICPPHTPSVRLISVLSGHADHATVQHAVCFSPTPMLHPPHAWGPLVAKIGRQVRSPDTTSPARHPHRSGSCVAALDKQMFALRRVLRPARSPTARLLLASVAALSLPRKPFLATAASQRTSCASAHGGMAGQMTTAQGESFGGPEVLVSARRDVPQAGPGQVLVKVMAAGVNPVETYMRAGTYARLPELPFVLGNDGAGVVEAVGPGEVRAEDLCQCKGVSAPPSPPLCSAGKTRVQATPATIGRARRARFGLANRLTPPLCRCHASVCVLWRFSCAGRRSSAKQSPAAFAVGDRVYLSGSLSGTYAQYCLCDASQVHVLPDPLSFEQGAAVGIAYRTAYRALFQRAHAKPGQTVFVHGASGGVGLAAVQLCRMSGIRVIGSAGTPEGMEAVSAQGAFSGTAASHGTRGMAQRSVACHTLRTFTAHGRAFSPHPSKRSTTERASTCSKFWMAREATGST